MSLSPIRGCPTMSCKATNYKLLTSFTLQHSSRNLFTHSKLGVFLGILINPYLQYAPYLYAFVRKGKCVRSRFQTLNLVSVGVSNLKPFFNGFEIKGSSHVYDV